MAPKDITPPIKDDIVDTNIAVYVLPFKWSGCPSITVTALDDSPGILNRIAEVDPAYCAPYVIDISIIRECSGVNDVYINGNNNIDATVGPIPGNIPTSVPTNAPIIQKITFIGVKNSVIGGSVSSNIRISSSDNQ